jgi:hypothetical protein
MRIGRMVVLGLASVITLLCVTLVLGAWRNDQAITDHLGRATGQVDRVMFDRTIVRFETPDGVSHSPPNGVLYPQGLSTGQLIRIEYDRTDPELARVAGRTWVLTLLPVGTTITITWLIAGPLLWWMRSRTRQGAGPEAAPEREPETAGPGR